MAFVCPECSTKSLSVTASLELPPDSRSDEITLQTLRCQRCGFASMAVYEESRRGSLFSESVDHRGYRVSAEEVARLEKTLGQCPRPRDARCRCSVHRKLGSKDAGGRLKALVGIDHDGIFAIRLG